MKRAMRCCRDEFYVGNATIKNYAQQGTMGSNRGVLLFIV